MIVAVDTSVLVAAVLARHERHAASAAELEALSGAQASSCVPFHALLESYSVLTRLPAPHRIEPRDARRLLHGSFGDWVVAGAPSDVWRLLEEASATDVTGGAIYDAVILEAALEAGARELLTWNAADFERLARGQLAVRTPSAT